MNFDHNKKIGIFKFLSGYRKLYLNSPKGYSRKIINVQTVLESLLVYHCLQEERLRGRGTETEDSLQKRLNTVQEALDYGRQPYCLVITYPQTA